jgi:hypothetical protein
MSTRRHLPILREASAPPSPPPSTPEAAGDAEPPPWHWIPLGTTVSLVGFALLAQGAAALSVRLLGRVYPLGATAAQVAHIRAAHPAAARSVELTAALIPVLALLLAVAVGSYVVGRRGDRTNARHGMLSGGLTVMIFWVVTGRLWSLLPLVPLAMALGHLAGRWGVTRRDRSLAAEG